MIPLTSIPWRLIGIGVVIALLGLFAWRAHAWREGYLERDKAVADFAAYGASVEAREKQMAKDRADDASRRAQLSLTLETARSTLELLRAHPIESVVYREKPAKDGKCDDPRIGPDWIRVYNEAAGAATTAVSAPH